MYLEEGTVYRVDCGKKVETSTFAETILLLVNQKSSNPGSGILDVETVYGTNDILVTVRNSACEYKMKEYLEQYGEVTTETVVLGIEDETEQRLALENGEIHVDNLDKSEGREFVKRLQNDDSDAYVFYKGFVID